MPLTTEEQKRLVELRKQNKPLRKRLNSLNLLQRVFEVWDEGIIEENTAAALLDIDTDELYELNEENELTEAAAD